MKPLHCLISASHQIIYSRLQSVWHLQFSSPLLQARCPFTAEQQYLYVARMNVLYVSCFLVFIIVNTLQVYAIEGSDLCLTGTAEVPLGAVYMDQIIPEEELPVRMAAFGHCFRTEAGAAGMNIFIYTPEIHIHLYLWLWTISPSICTFHDTFIISEFAKQQYV